MDPTDRSIPPEMITRVAPTAITAKKLASVAVWISVYELRKLLIGWPVTRSTWLPAKAASAPHRTAMTSTRPAWGELIAAATTRRQGTDRAGARCIFRVVLGQGAPFYLTFGPLTGPRAAQRGRPGPVRAAASTSNASVAPSTCAGRSC